MSDRELRFNAALLKESLPRYENDPSKLPDAIIMALTGKELSPDELVEARKALAMIHDLRKRFFYQRPSNDYVVKLHEQVAERTHGLAEWITEYVPDSRGKSLALTKLEEVRMWANQAIAMEQPSDPDVEERG